jgi:HSP20 family molecular chaperone IbpA
MKRVSCWHTVKHRETKAKFESGLLSIDVPFDETMHGYKVPIE